MSRTEQQAPHGVISSEQQLVEGEIIFSKQLTLRELLKLGPKTDEATHLLDDVSFDFEVRDLGDSFLNIASFPRKEALGQNRFYQLLSEAKPGGTTRGGQGIGGVLADWRIILPEVRRTERDAKRLYEFHTQHVPGFLEFERNHFQKFWDMMSDKNEIEEHLLEIQFRRFISEEKLLAQYGFDYYRKNPRALRAIFSSYDFRHALDKLFKSRNPRSRLFPNIHVQDFREALEKGLSQLPEPEKLSLLEDFYNEQVSARGAVALGLAGADSFVLGDSMIAVDENGHIKDQYSIAMRGGNPFLHGADSIKHIGNREIEVRKGRSYLIVSFEDDSYTGHKEAVIKDRSIASHIAPLIIWKRNKQTGEASFFCGQVPSLPGHDTLLGQLIVSAYSPQVRDQMPSEIKMRGKDGREITQQMLEAQTILLVPRFENKFLTQSPVILGLEALAKT